MTTLPPDVELVEALRRGDAGVFAAVLDAWSSSMIRLARSFTTDHASAEDVVQETWLAVLNGVHGFEGRSSLRTWVYRILVNTARRQAARASRTVPWTSLLPEDHGPTVDPSCFQDSDGGYPGHWRELPPAWVSPESSALSAEVHALLARALDGLPPRQRVVISLRDVDGHTADEVCAILRISAANQRVLLHRARAAVRQQLAGYLAGSEDGA